MNESHIIIKYIHIYYILTYLRTLSFEGTHLPRPDENIPLSTYCYKIYYARVSPMPPYVASDFVTRRCSKRRINTRNTSFCREIIFHIIIIIIICAHFSMILADYRYAESAFCIPTYYTRTLNYSYYVVTLSFYHPVVHLTNVICLRCVINVFNIRFFITARTTCCARGVAFFSIPIFARDCVHTRVAWQMFV